MSKTTHTAVYIRTSTRKKEQDGKAQKHALEQRLQRDEVTDAKWYPDIGHSGAKEKRPGLDALLAAAERGEVSKVYVYSLDRLGRSLRHVLELFQRFQDCKVPVITLREGIDLTTPMGVLQLQMMAAFAQFEHAIISERVRSGVKRIKDGQPTRSGKPMGRPPVISAELKDKARKLARTTDYSVRMIAKKTGLNRGTVLKIVQEERSHVA